VTQAVNPDPARGMFSSIQAGLAEAPDGHPILVLPGDMPFVRSATIAAVAAHARESGNVVSPRFSGRRGHPVALPGSLREGLLRAAPASTLADILDGSSNQREYIDVDDPGVLRDVDTRADLDLHRG
jgi:molybdenum cofactor cytidylyltransferase